jgi:hypothetical protein
MVSIADSYVPSWVDTGLDQVFARAGCTIIVGEFTANTA